MTRPADDEKSYAADVVAAHDAAVARGDETYLDPDSGFMVMTSAALAARGSCCGSGCRHCPYPESERRRAGRPGS